MVNKQPEALRLADWLDSGNHRSGDAEIAAELRRLHAENEDFRATCDHLTRENAEQIGKIVALKEQRDELLGALEYIVHIWVDGNGSEWNQSDAAAQARAAIAKAGGAT